MIKNYLNLNVNALNKKRKMKIQQGDKSENPIRNNETCKIKNGIVRNMSRNLLIGSFVLVLSSTSLTGCKAYGFDYEKNSLGTRYAAGTVDEKYIDNCYYLQIYNKNFNDYKGYITLKQNDYGKVNYLDVFTLDTIYVENDAKYGNVEISNSINISDYLKDKDALKENYDVEYMEDLLEEMNTEFNGGVKQLKKQER